LADKVTTSKTTVEAAPGARKRSKKAAPRKKTKAKGPLAREIAGPMGQMSALTAKLIELADAGVGLGMNVVSLLSSLAKSHAAVPASADDLSGAARPQPAGQEAPPADASSDRSGPRNYCVVNRTPLFPGSPVQVSFSINNDVPDSPKNLLVSARGFTGAARGFQIDNSLFLVDPPERLIAAMDFDRFVLKGSIPKEAPEDTYNGWILVDGDEQLRIPVVLLVSHRS
jgi:hypothetical protein